MPSGDYKKKYSQAVFDRICELAAEGQSFSAIAKDVGINVQTISQWRIKHPEFDRTLSHALEIGFDVQADNLDVIADAEPDVQRARLKCENIRWRLARRAAHKYGDRIDVNVTNSVDISQALADARSRSGLIPLKDLSNVIDAQVIDVTNETESHDTDSESGDAESISIGDLLS